MSGYVGDNFVALQETFGLGREDLTALARVSFESSFMKPDPAVLASPRDHDGSWNPNPAG